MRISLAGNKDKPVRKRVRLENQKPAAVVESVAVLEKPSAKAIFLEPNKIKGKPSQGSLQRQTDPAHYAEPTSDSLAPQIELLPPPPDEKDYEQMPVEDFLSALSQGMGVKYEDILEAEPAAKAARRPARAGIGAKE